VVQESVAQLGQTSNLPGAHTVFKKDKVRMLKASKIYHSFGLNQVLSGVDLELAQGAISGLVGPSGGGKSVLLKILGGVWEAQSGVVSYGDLQEDQISLMFQEGALFDSISVFDNVAFPLVAGDVPVMADQSEQVEQVRSRVEEILGHVGLKHAAFKIPAQLSGGMRRRISLARALVGKPKLVLLDDPTSGLDPVASSVIMDLICDIHSEYRPTMLLVSHDLRRLLPIVSELFALFDGTVRFKGQLEHLLAEAPGEVQRFISCRYDLSAEQGEDEASSGQVR